MAARLSTAAVRSLKLSGGEPTTRPDLSAIVDAVGTSGLHPVVITNGISIHDAVFDAMEAQAAEFKFSIHRPDARNDNVLRVRTFEQILANLASCRRRNIAFSLNVVVTSQTIDLMDAMAEFATTQGARKISFIPVVPRGRAVRSGDHIDQLQLRDVNRRVGTLHKSYSGRLVVRCIDIRHHDYWIVENDGTLWIERAREGMDVRVCGLDELLGVPGRRGKNERKDHFDDRAGRPDATLPRIGQVGTEFRQLCPGRSGRDGRTDNSRVRKQTNR